MNEYKYLLDGNNIVVGEGRHIIARANHTLQTFPFPQPGAAIGRKYVGGQFLPTSTPARVTIALHAFLRKCNFWQNGLLIQGGEVEAFGKLALISGRQGGIAFARNTTIPLELREVGLINLEIGAVGITSPEDLAANIDQYSAHPDYEDFKDTLRDHLIIWIDPETGARIPLQTALANADGDTDPNFKLYSLPVINR